MITTVPCGDEYLGEILTSYGEVKWRFDNTLASRALGDPLRAKRVWSRVSWRPYSIFWVLLLCGWITVTTLELFEWGNRERTRIAFLVLSSLVTVPLFAVTVFFIDTKIAHEVVRTWEFSANVGLSIVAVVSVELMWGGDERIFLGVALVAIIAFLSMVDSFPPELRRMVGIPILSSMMLVMAAVLVLFTLGRFPAQDLTYRINLGDMSGIARRNVTFSPSQTATDAILTFTLLLSRLLFITVSDRRTGFLTTLKAHIRFAEETEEDEIFGPWFDGGLKRLDRLRVMRICGQRGATEAVESSTKHIPVYQKNVAKLLNEEKRVS